MSKFSGNRTPQSVLNGRKLNKSLKTAAKTGGLLDYGGENTINGIDKDDKKQNIAWAFSFTYPISRYSDIKVAYIGTRTQESTGLDSDTLAASLSYLW